MFDNTSWSNGIIIIIVIKNKGFIKPDFKEHWGRGSDSSYSKFKGKNDFQ